MTAALDYPLQRDAAEHARLQTQAAFWSTDAAALFDSVPVAPGWQVADLGCGTLHVAQALLDRVGSAGRVIAIDNDAALLQRLRSDAVDSRLHLECGDAFDSRLRAHSLDAVHARFMAAPCGRLDALLAEVLRLLRPGGWLMLQEPQADSWAIPAAGEAWTRLKQLIRAGFEARGGDFDAGAKLPSALARLPVSAVRMRQVVHTLPSTHPYARLPLDFARSLRPVWRASHLADDSEIDGLVGAIERALTRPGGVTTFTLVQAWAKAQAASSMPITRRTSSVLDPGPAHAS
ncbi:class I SAM-dependent methyltransferase [Ideonella sp. YS5]|uniref:class I SAM-dependent methyltransferase n=1 Tax=Ideonella sp. YS5 TaxID=3453714 RepID=UPI003EEE5BB7